MAKIMMTGERKQIQVPVILPTVGTSGSIPLTVPFKAEYFAVLNSSGATINMARGRLAQNPADSITISPNIYISLSIEETQEMTLFWNGGVNSSNNQLLVIFSNEEIPVLGGSMVTGGVASNVTVSNTPNVVISAGTANIGHVNVDNFPATQNVAGTVGVNNFPATQNVAGTVGVNNFPATQTVAGTVTANVGTTGNLAQAATTGLTGNSQAAITTTAAALTLPTNVRQIVLKNMDASATVYVGGSGVTTGNGFPISAQGTFSLDVVPGSTISIYAIGSAVCTLAILGVA